MGSSLSVESISSKWFVFSTIVTTYHFADLVKHQLVERRIGDNPKAEKKQLRIAVSLRPDDPFAKKMLSRPVETRNMLIRVTVPRRTGRKRKRGSDEPFQDNHDPDPADGLPVTAPALIQRLRDNEGSYNIEPVGLINEGHRFRGD